MTVQRQYYYKSAGFPKDKPLNVSLLHSVVQL